MATYTPPGVFVADSLEALYSASSVSPSSVGIFGETASALSYTETVIIPEDIRGEEDLQGQTPPDQPASSDFLRYPNATNIVVKRFDNNELLVAGVDYELVTTTSDDATYTAIRRIEESLFIPDTGTTVVVTYSYLPLNFGATLRFTSAADVATFYGDAFDAQGNIVSPLTLAAKLAFENGALSVITRAVLGDTEQDYADALESLNKATDIAVITCASGDSALIPMISLATKTASAQELERRAIVGVDGTASTVTSENLVSLAKQTANKRVALVAPTVVDYRISSLNRNVQIGGQYLAAAVAGESVALGIQEPLTRKTVFGLAGIPEAYVTSTKNNLSANGVMVVEETLQGVVRIRHGVTTDVTNKNNSEWSVVGVTDYIVGSARSMLDNAGFIGSAITPATIPSLIGMMTSFLSSAVSDNIIGDYDQLAITQRTTEPDVIDVRFAIGFMFPLNRIYVTMSSSASTGTTTTTTL